MASLITMLPMTIGESTLHTVHGTVYRLKRLSVACWYLENTETGRARFGERSQIEADILHLEESGVLPHSQGQSWA